MRVVITGGATGIGRSCVNALLSNDIDLIYFSSVDAAKELESCRVKTHRVDVTNESAVATFFDSIEPFDVLINNAGGNVSFSPTTEYDKDDWIETFNLNTMSVFLMCKYGIPIINDGGRIINISSISATTGGAPGGMAYAASKAAVNTMTKSLSKELAEKNICVNAIAPGIVWTKQHEKFSSREYYNTLIEKVPMGRDGKPEDIAGVVEFLCSDKSSYITGQVFGVNGGMLM